MCHRRPLLCFLASLAVRSDACQSIEEYTLPTSGPLADAAGSPPGPNIVGLIAGLQTWTVGLRQYETPQSVRFTVSFEATKEREGDRCFVTGDFIFDSHLIDEINWKCAAVYSPSWKDANTKSEPLIRSPSTIGLTTSRRLTFARLRSRAPLDREANHGGEFSRSSTVDLHNSDVRLLCMVHAWATVVEDWVPEAATAMFGYINAFQYSNVGQGYNSQVDVCFDIDGDGAANITCLEDVAESNCYTPSVMGAIVARQETEYARRDGWNQYGDLNRDGSTCTANCRRFTDTSNYLSQNDPGSNEKKFRWQPLLEDNGRGYFTRQEHVAPHIGTKASPIVISSFDMNERKAPKANTNAYNERARTGAARLAALDDEKKMLIEFFDDKIAVVFAVVGAVAMKGASFEQILNFVLGMTAGDLDATVVAWKEKVEHDLVRPTTWIQDQMGDETFTTWGGPFQGTKDIKGKDFESYIRVMPHSEYVSGSGCICQALYEVTDSWIATNLGIPNSLNVTLPLFPAGSSKTEPGVTPASDISLTLPSMLALRDACGQSRLDGGMHFDDSVTAAYDLCEGIGEAGASYANSLW